MSVKLRKRKNANGTTSLRLDIHHDGRRWIETLNLLQLAKVTNPNDRLHNKEKLSQAEKIAVTRAADLQAHGYSIETDTGKKTVVTEWMQWFVDAYTKKDKRNMQGVLNKFKCFLKEEKKDALVFGHISALLIEDFIQYLEERHTGEGASSYYNRFKKMLKQAYRKRLMKENVLEFIERKVKGSAKKKEVLLSPELERLFATPIQSEQVRNAFLFCCLTGLRWCDVKALKWKDVRMEEKCLRLKQSKTQTEVIITLNITAINMMGEPRKPDDHVFLLPTANGANKTIKAWMKRAGIEKTITWHNARHSFGTNLIYNNVPVLTASKLLGHTSLKHTYRYVETAQSLKEEATDKLNLSISI